MKGEDLARKIFLTRPWSRRHSILRWWLCLFNVCNCSVCGFDSGVVNFPFLVGSIPRSAYFGVYISQLIRFARASSNVADFNTDNKTLTNNFLKQGDHKLLFDSKFYCRYYALISKFHVPV